jgi:aryl-alcohol dehydrogenase-like predicted oxidoreductase
MNQRRLGRTGLKVSEICLGTMTFANQSDEATAFRILDTAVGRGVTFIDTADCYPIPPDPDTAGATEAIIGRWLEAAPGRRDSLVLATKCRIRVGRNPNDQGLSRRHILAACDASLKRLRTDYVDLFQAHSFDPETPIDETLRAFDDLVRAGKVRYVGCSNYAAWQLALAIGASERHGWARYDCVQPRYNAIFRDIEAELLPLCRDQGIGVIAYNPLAGGLLTGKHSGQTPPAAGTRFTLGVSGELYRDRYWHSAQFDAIDALKKHCEARDLNLATSSVAWVLAQPGVTSAIVGASRPEQLEATLAAADVTLDDETKAAFDSVWWTLPRRPVNR